MLVTIKVNGLIKMRLIHAWYNIQNNSVEINTYDGYILCSNTAEEGLQTTIWGQHCIDTLALDNPLECATEVIRDISRTLKYLEDNVLLELSEKVLIRLKSM